jgi:hypothetical protein
MLDLQLGYVGTIAAPGIYSYRKALNRDGSVTYFVYLILKGKVKIHAITVSKSFRN